MKHNLIIITGKARAGKDTSAEFLELYLRRSGKFPINTKFHNLAFAAALKEFCIDVLGLESRHCYGSTEEKNLPTHIPWTSLPLRQDIIDKYRTNNNSHGQYMTGREVMEIFGSYICREMDTDCWARATAKTYRRLSGVTFITDCRFPNEISIFKQYNPLIIRLLRNPQNRASKSETALDNFDWTGYTVASIDNHEMTIEQRNHALCVIADKYL
jgi:hypothetical protein